MKSNELRIGNYILNPYQNKIYTVSGINDSSTINNKDRIYIKTKEIDEYSVNINVFKPIQLTEDILVKCGFVKIDNDRFELKSFGIIDISTKQGKHLHQLQNLYFALTGEELEITL